jgi:hypothetical protein
MKATSEVVRRKGCSLTSTFVASTRYNRSMATTAEVVARVSRLASGQWGLLTAAQAEREAVTRSQLNRLAEAGVLERVERGVYATTSSTDENRALRAAWLALDPARTAEERLANTVGAGVVSHTSAAGLHKLGDLLDDVPEVTYPQRKQTRRGIRVHRGDLTEADITLVDGLPTTTEERTVADLIRDGHDPEHVAQIIGQGVRRGVIDLPDLAEHLEPLARRYGQPDGQSLVTHLLDLVGLSPAALARDLAKSPAGQGLLAAGRATAFTEMLASLGPTLNPLVSTLALNQSIGANLLGRLDIGKIAGLDRILEAMSQPAIQAVANMRFPAIQDAFAQFRTPEAQAAIEAVQSPAVVADPTSLSSQEEWSPSKATLAQSSTDETEVNA